MLDEIARRLRARRAMRLTPMHAQDCPIADCLTCQQLPERPYTISSPALFYGRQMDPEKAASQVACWLKDHWPEAWYGASSDVLLPVAVRLIRLRDAVEARRGRG
jgi:hypothetical protein